MHWSTVHSRNGFLVHRDALGDPLLAYVQAAEALILLLVALLCVLLAMSARVRDAVLERVLLVAPARSR